MPSHCTHVSAAFNRSHNTPRVFARDPSQTQRNHTAHATHSTLLSNNPNYLNPPFLHKQVPLPIPRHSLNRARSAPATPPIRFPFTMRSQSHFHPLPHPTSHPPPSPFTPKPTPTLMKSHAAPNFESKPLFYPEGTYEPLATPRHPKHSPDPNPPSPATFRPQTPSNRMQLRFRV
jgi:hypothetical protein